MPRVIGRVGAILLLLVLTACSAGPSDRPAVAYRGEEQPGTGSPGTSEPRTVPPLGPSSRSALDWSDCTEATRRELAPGGPAGDLRFSCTHLLTSLDPPGAVRGGTTRLALLAAGSGDVPLVVVNDVRGEPGTVFAARLASELPEEVLREFRIIGMDRRGTGDSDPANCVPEREREDILRFDTRASDDSTLDDLLESVRSASQKCLLELERRAQAYDTRHTADDLEELRLQLGVPRLHAIGRGEGSRALSVYAHDHPDATGRMVFDGAPDPTLRTQAQLKRRVESAERTFDVFAENCGNSGGCPLGDSPRERLDALIERTRERSLPTDGAPLTSGELTRAVLHGLGDRQDWSRLAEAIAAAENGDGNPLAEFVRNSEAGADRLGQRMVTRCNDTMLRLPPERAANTAEEWVNSGPLFGGVFAQRLIRCSAWPRPQQALPSPGNVQLPRIPVIATENDPLTPATGSENAAAALSNGSTVNWLGSGHGALGRSECVTALVSDFLVSGEPPPRDAACPA
ncbi:alpha/beta hydrolase [Actinopolyspora erythraea]|uniref:Alpha/beta hydrolase n=1 Tax=Actinopolyspora erythraea TaxID=414996 RepID=A0A099D4L8_9ACTN|nr:alpha/beta hydrolase [Actinopolyspora erythraea]ASU79485.1 alpha/beta hydrolase [Actinopolyspora erythraea]KGI80886.1 proteinase [Actinopolyspora erythraea]